MAGTPGINVVQQVSFDPRIQNSLTTPFSSGDASLASWVGGHSLGINLYRGFLLWDTTVMAGQFAGASPPSIRFLFNPSTISASYQITDATAQAALIFPVATQQPILRVPLQQQVGFTIMFDRTYEMNSANPPAVIANLGVEADIRLMKQLTGMYNQVYSGNNPYIDPSTGNTVTNTPNVNVGANPNGTGIQQGVMQLTFVYAYFSYPGYGLEYYGYIDSWSVQYTHFNQRMLPLRAVVDVSLTLLPPPTAQAAPATAASVAAQQTVGAGATGGPVGPGGIGPSA